MQEQVEKFLSRMPSKASAKSYRAPLERLMAFCEGVMPTKEAVAERKFWDGLLEFLEDAGGLSAGSINYNLTVAKKFLGTQLHCQISAVKRLKAPRRAIRVLEPTEVTTLLANAAEGQKLILEAIVETGMRLAEAEWLSRQTFEQVPERVVLTGKGGRQRIIVFSERLQKKLRPGLLFGRVITRRQIDWAVRRAVKKANLPGKVSTHTLRHAFATKMIAEGVDVTVVQRMLGHSSITTTQIYTHISDMTVVEAWRRVNRGVVAMGRTV